MTLNSPLSDMLVHIMNCERIAKTECTIKPASKLIKEVLKLLNKEKYVGDFEVINQGTYEILKLNLLNNINKIGVIRPHFSVKKDGFEKFEKRFLPSKELGFLIVSTPKGLMTSIEAKQKGLGGRLLAYVY
ncbi:30S ribosomal protein S8 [archaeon]|nr:30S ribosomal protein S8 [archaeon]